MIKIKHIGEVEEQSNRVTTFQIFKCEAGHTIKVEALQVYASTKSTICNECQTIQFEKHKIETKKFFKDANFQTIPLQSCSNCTHNVFGDCTKESAGICRTIPSDEEISTCDHWKEQIE